ncbi:alpha/beta hydrolase [Fimbriiglobus ruber]|uniref:Hydrolase alpha/beta fold family n=1 Tax=Fimbriiglobus ruber TaxID=1908690 RepID=A0A225E1G2_9BACT|nr:alpha/beta hydrolase [Fimbriiglobus ruber]OWK45624.1 hydrolase alpha/beta fold family [Fimbriiglobus ruber]
MWVHVVVAVLVGAAGPRVTSEPAELKTDSGTLFGTLDLPPGKGPFPVVLIHPGSGPTDRDGNQARLKNDSLKYLGRALAARGIACLRVDKRGVAASAKAGAAEADLRFDTYVSDAVRWIGWLRADKRFGKVGVVGHSEGALVGALAAPTARVDAVVLLCATGRTLDALLREQLKKNLPDKLFAQSEPILNALAAGKQVKDVPAELKALFRPSVQPYLISILTRDPIAAVAAVKCPLLVVSGTTDIQVTEVDAKALSAARAGIKAVRIENMNHMLKEIESTNTFLQTARTYANTATPLHPKLAGELAAFLATALAAGR